MKCTSSSTTTSYGTLHVHRELKPSDLKAVTDLAAQEKASVSGATRQAQQQQQQRDSRARVPERLRGLPQNVLERIQQLDQK